MPPILPYASDIDQATPGTPGPEAPEPMQPGAFLEPELQDDGSAYIPLLEPGQDPAEALQQFDVNLADLLPEDKLGSMAERLLWELEQDRDASSKRRKDYADALNLANVDPSDTKDSGGGGDGLESGSIVGHPTLIEAAIDFEAQAIKELYPTSGPVRTHLPGVVDKDLEAKADRKRDFLNWQLNKLNYRNKLEVLLSQLPFEGRQYIKVWRGKSGARLDYVPSDAVVFNFSSTGLEDAERACHEMHLSGYEVQDRVEEGVYRDTVLIGALEPEKTAPEEVIEKVSGKQDSGLNIDEVSAIYEVSVDLAVDGDPLTDGQKAPYIITIHGTNRRVLALYRNWDPEDPAMTKLDWLVEFPFIPWRGAPLSLYQIIGSLSVAARGALRALLDSAHVNNFPGVAKLKGGLEGQNVTVNAGSVTELAAPGNVDDIRKLLMPMPYNQPSAVLFQLLGWLTDAAKGVVSTAEEKLGEAAANQPVGTTLALIEQGSKVFSAIHARLHAAQERVLRILCRVNKGGFDMRSAQEARLEIQPGDFETYEDVVPVSDPNIFSEAQRYAQLQAVFQLAQDQAVPYERYELHRRALKMLRVPDPDSILPPPKKPQPLNPAAENVQLSMGAPAIAFPDQDHQAHLEVHLRFFADPYLGGSSFMVGTMVPQLTEHVKQHLGLMYGQVMDQLLTEALGAPPSQLMQDPQQAMGLDKVVAAASALVHQTMQARLEAIREPLDALLKAASALSKNTAEDPRMVAAKAAVVDVERRVAKDQDDAELSRERLAQETRDREANRTSKEAIEAAKLESGALQFLLEAMQTDQPNVGAGQRPTLQ